MTERVVPANHYEALRVERTSYAGSGPQPQHARLALRAADAITQILVKEAVVNSRDLPITPVSATRRSRHNPNASDVFDIPNLRYRHPVRNPPWATKFWLFGQRDLENAHLRQPGDLAFPIAAGLRDVFVGTEYWNGRFMVLRSGRRRISLPNLVIAMDEAPIEVPEAPLSTRDIVTYAADIGNLVATRVTGADDVGDVTFYSEAYRLMPRSHTLIPGAEAPDADQITVVPPR